MNLQIMRGELQETTDMGQTLTVYFTVDGGREWSIGGLNTSFTLPEIQTWLQINAADTLAEAASELPKSTQERYDLNPVKSAYRISQLYGKTQQEIQDYIDAQLSDAVNGMTPAEVKAYISAQMGSITNLTQAKTVIEALFQRLIDIDVVIVSLQKTLASVLLYLVHHTELDK